MLFVHFISGVVALGFTLISFVSGIITLFSPKVRLLIKHGPIKILHISVGMFAIAMGLITMAMGLYNPAFRTDQEGLSTALIVIVVIIISYILVQPIMDLISTIKKTF